MEERRLGPVVGLGTWNTFAAGAELAGEVVRWQVGAIEARLADLEDAKTLAGLLLLHGRE